MSFAWRSGMACRSRLKLFALLVAVTGAGCWDDQLAIDGGPPPVDVDAGCLVTTTDVSYSFACALPEPCAEVIYDDMAGWITPTAPPAINLDGAVCALQHLRDDLPAALTIHHGLGPMGFDDAHVWVEGDGSAILYKHYRYDLFDQNYRARRFARKDRSFFDACLAETDPTMVYECLTHWWVDGSCFAADSLPCNP